MKDVTKHDLAKHIESVGDEEAVLRFYNTDGTSKNGGHTEDWYKFWPKNKNKALCPTCGVEATFK